MWFKPSELVAKNTNSTSKPPATIATIATKEPQKPKVSQLSQLSQLVEIEESTNSDLLVMVWTPSGTKFIVQARDAEHAAFLLKMNPKPGVAQ